MIRTIKVADKPTLDTVKSTTDSIKLDTVAIKAAVEGGGVDKCFDGSPGLVEIEPGFYLKRVETHVGNSEKKLVVPYYMPYVEPYTDSSSPIYTWGNNSQQSAGGDFSYKYCREGFGDYGNCFGNTPALPEDFAQLEYLYLMTIRTVTSGNYVSAISKLSSYEGINPIAKNVESSYLISNANPKAFIADTSFDEYVDSTTIADLKHIYDQYLKKVVVRQHSNHETELHYRIVPSESRIYTWLDAGDLAVNYYQYNLVYKFKE